MPVATSSSEQANAAKMIEDTILKKQKDAAETIKILLLGAGECGKSTVLKQMKILHMNGFSADELTEGRNLVFKNTLDAAQALCAAMKDLGVEYTNPDCAALAEKVMKQDSSNSEFDLSIAKDIATIWADTGIQAVRKRDNEFYLLDSAPYFLDKVEKIFVPTFQPSSGDMLRTRLTTTVRLSDVSVLFRVLWSIFTLRRVSSKQSSLWRRRSSKCTMLAGNAENVKSGNSPTLLLLLLHRHIHCAGSTALTT